MDDERTACFDQNRGIKQEKKEGKTDSENIHDQEEHFEEITNNRGTLFYNGSSEIVGCENSLSDESCSTSPQEHNEQIEQAQQVQFAENPPVVIPLDEVNNFQEREPSARVGREHSQPLNRRVTRPPRSKVLGNMSYSDIIAMAIESSEQKKLTLCQIYEWIAHNIPYFRNKSDSSSPNAGWKNAIRHTLSIRKRFIRLPNESSGRSSYNSWWTTNPNTGPREDHEGSPHPASQRAARASTVSRGTQTEGHYFVYIPAGGCTCSYSNNGLLVSQFGPFWSKY